VPASASVRFLEFCAPNYPEPLSLGVGASCCDALGDATNGCNSNVVSHWLNAIEKLLMADTRRTKCVDEYHAISYSLTPR